MKNKSFHHFLALSLMISFFSFSACDIVISSVGELPDEAPGADNPKDPESENFTVPNIQLVDYSGNHFFIQTTELELFWQPVESMANLLYRYKIAPPSQTLEEVAFSDYSPETFLQLSNLDETFNNEAYEFVIEVSSAIRPEKKAEFLGSFEVDALQGRSFLFRPRTITMNNDGTYTAKIFIDEIEESDDLTALALVIDYNSNELTVLDEDITIHSDESSFLYREGGEIISFHKIENNRITIEAGVAGNNLPPLSGGGAICEINFTPKVSFASSALSVSTSSVFKTSDGFDIAISAFDEAFIVQ